MHITTLSLPNFAFHRQLIAGLIAILLAWQIATGAVAQDIPLQQKSRLVSLYDALLDDPTNIDRTIEYSELAEDMGDYEAAIPPLERILLTHPNSARIQFQLGTLYHRLSAYDAAKAYFEMVLEQSEASEALKDKARQYLENI